MRIKDVFLRHSCSFCKAGDHSDSPFLLRQRGMSINIVKASSSVLIDTFTSTTKPNSSNLILKSFKEAIDKEDTIKLSSAQASKIFKEHHHDTYDHHLLDFTKLQSTMLALKKNDPEGVYVLETCPVTEQYSQKLPEQSSYPIMFKYYIIMPSACIKLYEYSRKIISMDACHMHTRFDGILMSINIKDANNENVTLLLALADNENKENWNLVWEVVQIKLQNLKMVISDKDKGNMIYILI